MKLFLMGILFCLASTARAETAVGDTATFEGIQNNQPFNMISTITKQVDDKTWSVHTKLNYLGKIKDSDEDSMVISRAAIQDILTNCKDMGGTPETVTVKAGKFDTCKLANPGSPTAWVGDVPFALVREENHELLTDGVQKVMLNTVGELSSFQRGVP